MSQEVCDVNVLSLADFEQQAAARIQLLRCLTTESPNVVETIAAPVEGDQRLVPMGVYTRQLRPRHVGQVSNNDVDPTR